MSTRNRRSRPASSSSPRARNVPGPGQLAPAHAPQRRRGSARHTILRRRCASPSSGVPLVCHGGAGCLARRASGDHETPARAGVSLSGASRARAGDLLHAMRAPDAAGHCRLRPAPLGDRTSAPSRECLLPSAATRCLQRRFQRSAPRSVLHWQIDVLPDQSRTTRLSRELPQRSPGLRQRRAVVVRGRTSSAGAPQPPTPRTAASSTCARTCSAHAPSATPSAPSPARRWRPPSRRVDGVARRLERLHASTADGTRPR